MPLEEQVSTSRRALNYSPSRGSSRIYGQTSSKRQHKAASAATKPPEPLRRAVADCLSAATNSLLPSESSRTLREYLANPSSTDLAYSLLIEHTVAERDRSPAVVPRCVALLKTYLLRYVPKIQTLRQIDQFCENSINACHSALNPTESLWSKSLSQQYGTPSVASHAIPPSKHASNFASPSLVKSLSYVRSLVARHIPKLSFQSLAKTGSSSSTKQLLPTLSSLFSRSLNSHISPEDVSNRESPQKKEILLPSLSESDGLDKVARGEYSRSVSVDLLTWRWSIKKEHQSSFFTRESDARSHMFLEVGAAAIFIGDLEAKAREQYWNYNRDQDLPDIDQLLHPSSATTASNFASSHSHLKAITASKRLKPGPHHTWTNMPVSTYHPRARPLFQYRHYSEQQPLRLNPSEISEVIAEACSDSASSSASVINAQLTNLNRRPPTEVAVSVLLKLVIDMYMTDSATAAPLALSMLEDILSSDTVASRVRVFDIILNLGVHAHLLEPVLHEDPLTVDEDDEASHDELSINSEKLKTMQESMVSAIDKFETWLLAILFEILQFLVQTEEQEEIVWASALSCLFFFVCDGGKILRSRLNGLDIRVIKALLEISRKHSWAEIVHCRLICMLTNMFYQSPHNSEKDGSENSHNYEEAVSEYPHNYEEAVSQSLSENTIFLVEQIDILGGIDFICLEYSQAYSRDEKRNLFLVLFDYVVHQINDVCLTSGISVYTYNEIQPVASLLSLANAPEAFYIAVKHGVQGIGEILRKPISSAMSRSSNYERLDMLLEKVTNKIDATISAFTCLNNEFSYMIQITKSFKYVESIEEGLGESDGLNITLSWATLHSLLHSERSAYHRNGYVWLAELLLSEVTEGRERSIWENIKKLQENIVLAGSQDLTFSTVPLSVCMLCGLLKSKHNYIRWGFLFVLDELLMRLKLLLDESETDGSSNQSESRLRKANAVIDVMSNALLLVVQINETDRINILKMCDIIFSQLCLRLQSHTTESDESDLLYGTPSMAALLLRGHAIVPMQLVVRVPESLFYWPLIQLAGAATDDIALDVAVGSEGGGNLPGATSDIRAALLLLLIGKCSADSMAFMEIEGEEFFRGLLDDTDSRVAYYSSAFLLKRMMTNQPENYQRMLQNLILKAQQSNNEKLLENPYLQMRGILKLLNDPGSWK